MHQAAVIILCALVGYFVWRDFVECLIAWYSGAEPPLTARAKVLIWSRAAVALAAGVVALVTL